MFGVPHPTMVDYWKVRQPTFKPIMLDSRRRREPMEADLVSVLGGCIPNLPWELLYQITGYASAGYAVNYLTTRMGRLIPQNCSIDLRRDVWADYLDFEGRRYIRALYNMSPNIPAKSLEPTMELLFSAKSYRATYVMLIEMSTLGIQRIVFVDDSSRPKLLTNSRAFGGK